MKSIIQEAIAKHQENQSLTEEKKGRSRLRKRRRRGAGEAGGDAEGQHPDRRMWRRRLQHHQPVRGGRDPGRRDVRHQHRREAPAHHPRSPQDPHRPPGHEGPRRRRPPRDRRRGGPGERGGAAGVPQWRPHRLRHRGHGRRDRHRLRAPRRSPGQGMRRPHDGRRHPPVRRRGRRADGAGPGRPGAPPPGLRHHHRHPERQAPRARPEDAPRLRLQARRRVSDDGDQGHHRDRHAPGPRQPRLRRHPDRHEGRRGRPDRARRVRECHRPGHGGRHRSPHHPPAGQRRADRTPPGPSSGSSADRP